MPPRPRGTPSPIRKMHPEIPMQPRQTPTPPSQLDPIGVGVLMISSLPPMASGADVYARQFYRGSKVPFRRYLPVTSQ